MARRIPSKDPRGLILAATGVAVVLALGVAAAVVLTRPKAPPPVAASHGMLQVEMGKGDEKLDPAKPLRCFVNGQFVGQDRKSVV